MDIEKEKELNMKWLYSLMGWCWHDYDKWISDNSTHSVYYIKQERFCKKCGFKQSKLV